MPVVTVVEIIADVRTTLLDADVTRWPSVELQRWLNAGYREIVGLRPDANSHTAILNCVAGPRQSLTTQFPAALRLLDVTRNVAITSNGGAVVPAKRDALDDTRPGWASETSTVDIEMFIFDPRLPKEFMVYPPATSDAQLEVMYSLMPAVHALSESQLNSANAALINIDDSFANPLIDYVLYQAFRKDSGNQINMARSASHYQSMREGLGLTASVNAATKPGTTA